MKTLRLVFLIIFYSASLFLQSCENNRVNDEITVLKSFNVDTVNFAHSMKGWELYSWPVGNEWNYSILMGTNRGKTYEEVVNNRIAVKGIDSLKMLLAKMPTQEEIFWASREWNQNITVALSFPGEEQIKEIQTFCEIKQLKLHINN